MQTSVLSAFWTRKCSKRRNLYRRNFCLLERRKMRYRCNFYPSNANGNSSNSLTWCLLHTVTFRHHNALRLQVMSLGLMCVWTQMHTVISLVDYDGWGPSVVVINSKVCDTEFQATLLALETQKVMFIELAISSGWTSADVANIRLIPRRNFRRCCLVRSKTGPSRRRRSIKKNRPLMVEKVNTL